MLYCLRLRGGTDSQALRIKREKKRINEDIERELRDERKRREREHRILLLGCGEAGKSTFIKQMRILHSQGFTEEEKIQIKDDIASNIIEAIQTLIQNAINDSSIEEDVKLIESLPPRPKPGQVLRYVDIIDRLWKHEAIQNAYERRNEFQLVECAKYFLSRVGQVLQPEYMPSNQDIVQTRVKTTGIIEHDFLIMSKGEKPRKLILIDVGGQRSERKKWIHCFENVMLLIFLTAVSEFDQVLDEDECTNRIQESLRLFQTILEYNWFLNTTVILFLNKKDLLEEKIKRKEIKAYFPEFEGPEHDYNAAIEFFSDKFRSMNRFPKDRDIYIHPTDATDKENIKVVDVIVQEIIMKTILMDTMVN
ncbi:G protein alpha q subunit-like [Tigriopus californicus]|uniref:G protein alpha q subunit-like n=1 Tax=Tigriopus californicus TaxID=6832 RepID=UPI0027DA70F3|nr:G protein alpha q subunit-like [Tigriopus californicus]